MSQYQCREKEFYAPCICSNENYLPILQCDKINQTALDRIAVQQYFGKLILSQFTSDNNVDIKIAHKVLKRLQQVEISCHSKHLPFKVEPIEPTTLFDPTSFRPILNLLKISDCNLGQLNYTFLNGLTDLSGFELRNSINIFFDSTWTDTLFSMSTLSTISISGCRNVSFLGLRKEKFYQSSSVKLTRLFLDDNQLDDENMDLFLSWIIVTSAGSLERLYIGRNALTKIPSQIASLRSLKQLGLSQNAIPTVKKGAFIHPIPRWIYLDNCSIETIEPGAFQGTILLIEGINIF